MTPVIGFQIEGVNPLIKRLQDFPFFVQQRMVQLALRKAGDKLAEAVARAAPLGTEPTRKSRTVGALTVAIGKRRRKVRLYERVTVSYDYGRLRANIRRRDRTRLYKGVPVVRVSPGRAFWGLFLEKGTARMRARPFFQAAVRKNRDLAKAELQLALVAAIRRQFVRDSRVSTRTTRGQA